MLLRIGYISPPVELVGTLYFGEVLTSVEQVLAGGVPQVAIEPLDRVPRLEPMMRSLAALAWTDEQNAGLGDVKAGLGSGLLGCPSLTTLSRPKVIHPAWELEASRRIQFAT